MVIQKPPDCVLLVALPLTREEFLGGLDSPEKDFAQHYWSTCPAVPAEQLWEGHYRKEAVQMERIASTVSRLGGQVSLNCTIGQFSDSLRRFPVAALFAHVQGVDEDTLLERTTNPRDLASQVMIEFADGLVPVADFVSAVPSEFHGVLDFRGCNSAAPGEALKAVRRDLLVIGSEKTKFPLIQLLAYQLAINTLKVNNCDYISASHQARLALLNAKG